jgi:hypothetical protein
MGSKKVSAPPPRDYYKEMSDSIRAQIDLAPQMMEAERRLIPQWQAMQKEQMLGQADNLKSFYREVMGDSSALLSQYGREFAGALTPIAESSRQTYEASLGGGAALQNKMRAQAMSDLDAGMGLTPEMQTQAQQMARAAATARGLGNTNRGIGAEVLGGYQLGLQREDRARMFSNTVLGNDMTISGNAYQQYGSPLVQSGMSALSPMGLAGMSMQYNQNLGPAYLQPESQYNANLVAANQNMAMQAATANAQASSGLMGGLIGAAGSFLGSKAGGAAAVSFI